MNLFLLAEAVKHLSAKLLNIYYLIKLLNLSMMNWGLPSIAAEPLLLDLHLPCGNA